MKKFVWQGENVESVDRAVMEFLAGEDVVLDRELFPFDIDATAAHVRGLLRIGILSAQESSLLCQCLEQLKSEFESGAFVLDDRYEDGHSAIEMYLTEKLGKAGAKVHTGRSRNDQVAVATRLYLRSSLQRLASLCAQMAHACLERAELQPDTPMPGYTHLQRAVPSSVGLWMGGFAEAFSDDLAFIGSVIEIIDCCPLGTAAGYGVNLPLDPLRMQCRISVGLPGTSACSRPANSILSRCPGSMSPAHRSCPTSPTRTWSNCCGAGLQRLMPP